MLKEAFLFISFDADPDTVLYWPRNHILSSIFFFLHLISFTIHNFIRRKGKK